jgi:hypothetical protein
VVGPRAEAPANGAVGRERGNDETSATRLRS